MPHPCLTHALHSTVHSCPRGNCPLPSLALPTLVLPSWRLPSRVIHQGGHRYLLGQCLLHVMH